MTPRRDSHFDSNGPEDNMDRYEDGWRVGYDVELNGVGFSEGGHGGTESDLSSSDSESEFGIEVIESTQHSGYRSLLMQLEEPSSGNISSCDDFDDCLAGSVAYSENNETEGKDVLHIKETNSSIREIEDETSSTPEAISSEVIPHQPIDIFLDEEKVEVIRAAMSTFTLPTPPQWPSLDNSQLCNIIKEKIAR